MPQNGSVPRQCTFDLTISIRRVPIISFVILTTSITTTHSLPEHPWANTKSTIDKPFHFTSSSRHAQHHAVEHARQQRDVMWQQGSPLLRPLNGKFRGAPDHPSAASAPPRCPPRPTSRLRRRHATSPSLPTHHSRPVTQMCHTVRVTPVMREGCYHQGP